MTTNTQKESELAHLEKTLELLGIKDYSVIDKDGESPDFIIEINGEIIGVEVTGIYRDLVDGNSAKTQSDLLAITDEAVRIYNDNGGIPLVFGFSFNGKVAVKNRKVTAKKIGLFLCKYTKEHFPKGIDTIQQIRINQNNDEFSLVRSVFAQPTDSATAVGLTVSGFDSISAQDSDLEKALRKKETLLQKYKERCNKIWLLIVLPSMQLAADFKLQNKRSVTIAHKFDAAYILDDYRNQVQSIEKA